MVDGGSLVVTKTTEFAVTAVSATKNIGPDTLGPAGHHPFCAETPPLDTVEPHVPALRWTCNQGHSRDYYRRQERRSDKSSANNGQEHTFKGKTPVLYLPDREWDKKTSCIA